MRYEEYAPPPGLVDHVLSLWSFQRPAGETGVVQHLIPPDACLSLALAARRERPSEVILVGAHDGPLEVPIFPGDRYWGIRFWPDAGAACLGLPAETWVGRNAPARGILPSTPDDILSMLQGGATDDEVRDALGRWAILQRWEMTPLDAAVRLAVLAIVAARGALPIQELPKVTGLSSRTILRRFRAATGLTLKRYAKVRRAREAVARHHESPSTTWSRIAADVGYADHAHLTREFREIHGAAPSEVARLIGRISHGTIRP
ncbi:MAG: AraC family transcriptional regulator [Gemmatimonadetes bacterium]|nr:AraC family transcriptional regulator [Gemmatimonadota bacterium]